jgi:aminopeptidase 2
MGQTWLIGGSVAVLLLINSIGTTVIPLRELHFTADRYSKSFGVRADNADYHLPVTVTPNRYKITLTPNFVDFDFDGEMDIEVTAETATSSISLHYDNITIHNITVTDDAAEDGVFLPVQREEYNEETNIYTITLNDALEPGNYSIHINYTGHLLDDMAGFYRSSYTDADGEVR